MGMFIDSDQNYFNIPLYVNVSANIHETQIFTSLKKINQNTIYLLKEFQIVILQKKSTSD